MSALLSADDLNDFISPGLACIKPVETLPPTPAPPSSLEDGEIEIEIDNLGNAMEVGIDGNKTTLSAAQISLADCLACSGCVTSAEEVLVAQHSHDQLLKAITSSQHEKVFVASVSHQTRSSLSVAFNKTIEQVDRLLIDLFINQMGFLYVVGTGLGRKLSLVNESKSMIQRQDLQQNKKVPVLSSICPGWVLYAEKTHPFILPMISTVKSAQQITGCLLKTLVSQDKQVQKLKVYHLSVMPCFDKKLESARKERNEEEEEEEEAVADVDCVLTAKELVTLVDQLEGKYQFKWGEFEGGDISTIYKSAAPKNWPFINLTWSNDSGSLSGGYSSHYLESLKAHKVSEGCKKEDLAIETISGRNSDIIEMRLINKITNETIGSAAIVNGFRNIQNLVRKLKPGKLESKKFTKVNPLVARRRARKEGTPSSIESTDSTTSSTSNSETADASRCDYVEIMACPGGCINGGGQISAPSDIPEKEWLAKALGAYDDIPTVDVTSDVDSTALLNWISKFSKEFGIKEDRVLRTWFQEVEKPTDPNAILLGAKW